VDTLAGSLDVQAFLITFREVLEALLIVGLITSYLKRVGASHFNKWVWTGAGAAVVASFFVALLFQVVLTGFQVMGSEIYLKITIMLISSVLLTQMVLWMADQSKGIKGRLESKLSDILTTGSVIGMIIHAFLVVVREGVETVFFFAGISGGQIDKAITSWGALFGVAVAGVVSYLFFRGAMRFSLQTFFRVTGAMIVLIAAGLLVQAIGMMQDIGLMKSAMPHVYNLDWLMPEHPVDEAHYVREHGTHPLISGNVGIFFKTLLGYSHSPSIEQILAYLGYFAVVFSWVRFKRRVVAPSATIRTEQTVAVRKNGDVSHASDSTEASRQYGQSAAVVRRANWG
jgi:high-affinity iron transporter